MLKNLNVQPAKPNKILMVLGVLQGYLRTPVLFLLGTLFSLPAFIKKTRKNLDGIIPEPFIKENALQAWLYIRLKEKIGPGKAFEIMRAFVIPVGYTIQQANFKAVEEQRTFENMITYSQENLRNGSTRWNEVEFVMQTPQHYELKVHNCMFYNFYSSLGIPELTRTMCAVDNAIFNTYLPEKITFHRNGIGNRIVDGAAYCQFVMEHHLEE